jgi:hypothetical protein
MRWQASDVTELRVHGISGAPAEEILDRPVVTRVAGDDHAGYYRVRPGFGDPTGPGGLTLEAYRWGNLTAGTAARTLSFLLLLPFLLSNVAIWTRPAIPGTAVQALCRILAATVTAMFVQAVVGASLDLIGWQCASYPACTSGREYLSWLAPIPVGPRLALLCAVPIGAIWLMSWLGSRKSKEFAGFQYGAERTGRRERLDEPGFWDRDGQLVRLRSIHLAVALGVLDSSLLAALTSSGRPVAVALRTLVAVLLAMCVALLCVPVPSGRWVGRGWNRAARTIREATIALTVVTIAYAIASRPKAATGQLPGFGPMVTGLFVAQTVLLLTLAVAVLIEQRTGRDRANLLLAMGPLLFNSAAIGLGAALSTALVYRVADLVDRDAIPGPTQPVPAGLPPLQPPIPYRWAALGAVAAVMVAVVSRLLWNWLRRPGRDRQAAEIVQRDFPQAPADSAPRIRTVRDVIAKSETTDQLNPLLFGYLILSLLGLTAAGLELAGLGPIQLLRRLDEWGRPLVWMTAYLSDIGTYLIGLFVIGLMLVAVFAYRSPVLRRLVGVLWDLGTFWPRVAHPYAPPCYAERAVPELARRISALATQGPVLVSAHSHGSVLAAAAILRLPPDTLNRVGLLTYGSPLRRLYSRLTPGYISDQVLHEVGDRVGWRWRNLWRDTDPIGGPIFSSRRPGDSEPTADPADKVDRRLRDPRDVAIDPMDTVPPPIERHWPYHTDPQYMETVAEVARMLRRGDTASVPHPSSGAAT